MNVFTRITMLPPIYLGEICSVKDCSKISMNKLSNLGALGAVENGVFMTYWYNYLDRFVGASARTTAVLTKCFLDQIFFQKLLYLLF